MADKRMVGIYEEDYKRLKMLSRYLQLPMVMVLQKAMVKIEEDIREKVKGEALPFSCPKCGHLLVSTLYGCARCSFCDFEKPIKKGFCDVCEQEKNNCLNFYFSEVCLDCLEKQEEDKK